MAAAVPIAKLGFLLIRTIAKPFAGRLKDFLKDHDSARKAFSNLGQMLHKVEVRVAGNEQYLKVDQKGKSGIMTAKVKPLEEEVRSSSKKDEQKKAALEKRFFQAEESIRQHKIQIESLTQELQRARQHVISLSGDAMGLMQARSFTDDDVDAAEARLQAWVSSFKDEAARRDSLLQLNPAPKPLHVSDSFFGELMSALGSLKDDLTAPAKQQSAHVATKPAISNEGDGSNVEAALRQLEANKKASSALRKAKSKKKSDDNSDATTSTLSPSCPPASPAPANEQGCGDVSATSAATPRAAAAEHAPNGCPPAAHPNAEWRNVAYSSVVLGIVISVLATR